MSHKRTHAEGKGYEVYVDSRDKGKIVIRLDNSTCSIQTDDKGHSRLSVSIPKGISGDIGEALVMYGTGDEDFATLLTDILKGDGK